MRAGPLRDIVTLERPVGTKTDTGSVRDNFEPWLIDIAAAVEDIRGNESWLASQQVAADVTTRVRIRYRPGVDATMRIRQRREAGSPTIDDVMDIQAVIRPDQRKEELHLFCTRRDAEGFRSGER